MTKDFKARAEEELDMAGWANADHGATDWVEYGIAANDAVVKLIRLLRYQSGVIADMEKRIERLEMYAAISTVTTKHIQTFKKLAEWEAENESYGGTD